MINDICSTLQHISGEYKHLSQVSWSWEERAIVAEQEATEATTSRKKAEEAMAEEVVAKAEVDALRAEVGAADARVEVEKEAAKAEVKAARAEAEAARAEVEAAKAKAEAAELAKTEEVVQALKWRDAEVVASQGPIHRAFAKRLIFAKSFSEVLGRLAGLVSANVVVEALDEVAKDFPTLDQAKYDNRALEVEELHRTYAQILMEGIETSQVLKTLARLSTLLTHDSIRRCPTDLDVEMVPFLEALAKEKAEDEEDDIGEEGA